MRPRRSCIRPGAGDSSPLPDRRHSEALGEAFGNVSCRFGAELASDEKSLDTSSRIGVVHAESDHSKGREIMSNRSALIVATLVGSLCLSAVPARADFCLNAVVDGNTNVFFHFK